MEKEGCVWWMFCLYLGGEFRFLDDEIDKNDLDLRD